MDVVYAARAPIDDAELSRLHASAFGAKRSDTVPWSTRLERHSLTWVTANLGRELIGFVNVIGDGGVHAIILDAIVTPRLHEHGIGTKLIERAADEARVMGCEWLHVDFEPQLAGFYLERCGFEPSMAGVLRLH